jgi:SAM-dependent methyltransferase
MTRLRFWRFGTHVFTSYRYVLMELFLKIRDSRLVLDAGCGQYGSFDFPLKSDSIVIGVDLDRSSLLKAKAHNPREDFVAAHLASLPFGSGTFDAVFCQDVLEHVERKADVVRETARVTRLGGTFVGSTTNLFNPEMLVDTLFQRLIGSLVFEYSGETHFERHMRFSYIKLHFFLKACFRKSEIIFASGPPFPPSIFLNKQDLPWFVRAWVLFDRLTSNRFLSRFKEMLVFEAIK